MTERAMSLVPSGNRDTLHSGVLQLIIERRQVPIDE